jgi:hypothetical protein
MRRLGASVFIIGMRLTGGRGRQEKRRRQMGIALRLAGFVLAGCFPLGAMSQPAEEPVEVQVGVGVVCDTAQQVERFVALHTEGSKPQTAIERVNAEAHSDRACGSVVVAFIPGKRITDVAVTGGTMRVTEVKIVGTVTQQGLQAVEPLTQYTAFFVKSEEA